jgi:transmembrane sensor
MEHEKHSLNNLLQRLRNNQCTAEELALLRKWLLQLDLSETEAATDPQLLRKIKSAMLTRITGQSVTGAAPVLKYKQWISKGVAAAIILVICSTTAVSYYLSITGKKEVGTALLPVTRIVNTANKTMKAITLPDGTQVWLNMGSELQYNAAFNKQDRRITLSGEAFFEVAANANKPFIVSAGNIDTKVLGTGFNIEAYSNESEIRVSLVHGKVAIEDKKHAGRLTVLHPNEMMRYSKLHNNWQIEPVVGKNARLWTVGGLVFNEVLLMEAIERIKKRYDLNIQYNPALLDGKKVTATLLFTRWQSSLETILFVHDLQYIQKKGTVYITRR